MVAEKRKVHKMSKEQKEEKKESKPKEMSLAEARELRKAAAKAQPKALSEQEKREMFRLYWAQEKSKYGKSKDFEQILWLHLKAMKMDAPEQFETGIKHFGLTKVR